MTQKVCIYLSYNLEIGEHDKSGSLQIFVAQFYIIFINTFFIFLFLL